MEYNNLILDASNFFFRNFDESDSPKLINNKQISYKTITNLAKGLNKLQNEFKPNFMYFVFDNQNSRIEHRKSLDPEYKSDRDRKPKFAYDTVELWKILLSNSGSNYRICYKVGFEADDLIFPLLKLIKLDSSILVSSDLDWARSIQNCVHWYNFKIVYDRHKFKDDFGFDPTGNSIKIYKAIKGDSSDNIPVGCPKLPIEFLNKIVQYGSISLFYLELGSVDWIPEAWKLRLMECKNRIVLNYRLVDFLDENIQDYIQECKSDIIKLDEIKQSFKMVTSTILW